jgi:hypothetical protein
MHGPQVSASGGTRQRNRLRHATTLPVPCTPAPRPPGAPDLASARAARLPDQLWPDWAVRLTDDPASSSHDKFLPAALLLPHSEMPLNQVTAVRCGRYSPVNARTASTASMSWPSRLPNSACCANWEGPDDTFFPDAARVGRRTPRPTRSMTSFTRALPMPAV